MQLVCRDRNRLALQADIVGAALHGIENILLPDRRRRDGGGRARGEARLRSRQPQLLARPRALAGGRYLSGRHDRAGAAALPRRRREPGAPPVRVPRRAGLEEGRAPARASSSSRSASSTTQLAGFMQPRPRAGSTEQAAILPSVVPRQRRRRRCASWTRACRASRSRRRRSSASSARPTSEAACFEVAVELAQRTLELPGVAGLHLISFRRDAGIAALCRAARDPDARGEEGYVDTVLRSRSRTVVIGPEQPFCVIGERINPTGRKAFQAQLQADDLSQLELDAAEQVAGADMLDVNVGDPLADEVGLMGRAIATAPGAHRHSALHRLVDRSRRSSRRARCLRGQGARQLGHRRGRAARGDPAARRQARRSGDRSCERRGNPHGARAATRDRAQDRVRRRRLRHQARGRRHRPARNARRRRAACGDAVRRGRAPDPRRARREHDVRRVEHCVRPTQAPARWARRSSRSRSRTG